MDDLALHTLVAAAVVIVARLIGFGLVPSIIAGVIAGVGKEAYDYFSLTGTAAWADIAADLVGVVVGLSITWKSKVRRWRKKKPAADPEADKKTTKLDKPLKLRVRRRGSLNYRKIRILPPSDDTADED